MNIADNHAITRSSIWLSRPGLMQLQLLGLCPLLAVSTSVVNATGLGLAMVIVLTSATLCVSLFRHQLPAVIRLPVVVMLIAALTTCVELVMQVYAFKLYQTLGIFVPLLVSSWMLLDRAENFASRNPPLTAIIDGLMMGAGFMLLLVVLGAIRELLGTGALFANMEQLLPFAAGWKLQLFKTDSPFLLATSPPGAFLTLGFLIALMNVISKRSEQAQPAAEVSPAIPGSKRARVTGHI